MSGGYPVQQREFSMRPMEVDNDGAGNKMTLATSATGSLQRLACLERPRLTHRQEAPRGIPKEGPNAQCLLGSCEWEIQLAGTVGRRRGLGGQIATCR